MSELDEALAAWDARHARLIKDRENAVHEVILGSERAALRLHRQGYQTLTAIRSEIDWMKALARAGMNVPAPLPTSDGTFVVTLSTGRLATMVSWIRGRPLGAAGEPLQGSEAYQRRMFHAVGCEVARLHNVTDGLDLPDGFARHAWDGEGLLGETPFWGRFWESPVLADDERDMILQARDAAAKQLADFRNSGGDYGLIHADVLRENVFIADGAVTLIDFDDAGWGFRLYDLATLMSQNEGLPNSDALRDAAIEGYRGERDLPQHAVALLPMFIMLRRFASMGWVVPRAGDRAKMRVYAERAIAAARGFLA